MNILELENLVKGAPDEYLIKEVQAPSGQIPQFLALSEVQRRKDMRDRYQAQQNGGQKPTIAEQIVGGGIGSLPGAQGAQGAPVPTPAATGIPSAGAPPAAPGAAPMPTPPGMPQGFAAGGLVKMAEAGVVPRGSEAQRRKPYEYNVLDAFKAQSPAYYNALKSITDIPVDAYYQANNILNSAINYDIPGPIDFAERIRKDNERYGLKEDNRSLTERLKAKDAERAAAALAMDMAKLIPQTGVKDYSYPNPAVASASEASPAVVPAVAASIPAPVPAQSGAREAYTVTAGGIGSINPNDALSGGAGPAVSIPGAGPAAVAGAPGVANPYGLSPEELAYQEYLKDEKNFKLPDALNFQSFIDEAMGEEAAIRAEAKKQALGAALVQLGAGLAAGDMAKGLSTAGIESRDIMSQGRKEASAQKALAQQFKLQGMQGERDLALKQKEMDAARMQSLASFAGGNRKEQQDRAMELTRLRQSAAQHAASIGIQAQQLGLSRERADIERMSGAMDYFKTSVAIAAGPEPTKEEIESAVMKGLPNPMDDYRQRRTEAAKIIAPEVEKIFRVPAKTMYADVVKPVSNPGNASATGATLKYDQATGGWK